MVWTGWPLERGVLLLAGLLFLGIFTQVTMFHSRQNFRFPSQRVPVVATPVLGALALLLVVSPSPAVRAFSGRCCGWARLRGCTGASSIFSVSVSGWKGIGATIS